MNDKYYMRISKKISRCSYDPNTKVGACIVGRFGNIKGTGYNCFPKNTKFTWNREGKWLYTKYPFVVHAELNAILNSRKNLKGCRIYVTLFPCNECAKAIVQAGIKEVIYLEDKYINTDSVKAAKTIFTKAGVKYRQLKE